MRYHTTSFASRSSLQLRFPALRPSAAAASWSACSCCRGACVSSSSSLLSAAEGHGDARVEHVAQLDEDDELLVAAQRRQRHRAAQRGGVVERGNTMDRPMTGFPSRIDIGRDRVHDRRSATSR